MTPILRRFWIASLGIYRELHAQWIGGAGAGRHTRKLCERFDTVYAVEPSSSMCEQLIQAAPNAITLNTTISEADLPEHVDLGIISHVYYHIPDHEWGGYTLRCASQLTERGVLVITLKHPHTACNNMLEAFGAPRFNIFSLLEAFQHHPEFTLTFQSAPGRITTHSFDETLAIARFMLSDRTPTAFSRLPSEQEFRDYVFQNLWNGKRSRGGWELLKVFAIIARNPFM